MLFSTNLNTTDPQHVSFEITESTWASDNLQEGDTPFGVGPSQANFDENQVYQSGSLIPLDTTSTATYLASYASFCLTNPEDFIDADSVGESFEVIVYQGVLSEAFLSFDNLEVVGSTLYTVTGEEEPNELLYVEFETPLELLSSEGYYYVSVKKTQDTPGGKVPEYIASEKVDYFTLRVPPEIATNADAINETPLLLDQMYAGWQDVTVVTRLHLESFPPSFDTIVSDIREVQLLDKHQIDVYPNPALDVVNLSLKSTGSIPTVVIYLTDALGRRLKSFQFDDVTEAPLQLDVNGLAKGTYFLNVHTSIGYRMLKFVKR